MRVFSVKKWTSGKKIQPPDTQCMVYLPTLSVWEHEHSNGISQFLIGNTSSKGPFSIAMLDYPSVPLVSKQ